MSKIGIPFSARAHLAMNLQVARTMHGFSQEQLGLMCGLHRTYIGALERKELNPGIDNLDRIAAALGVPVHVLVQTPAEAYATIYAAIDRLRRPSSML